MNKNTVNYEFKYVNNSDTIMLFWISAGENISYKVYVGGDGEFRLAGSSAFNYFITDAENIKEAYVEAYDSSGEYISTSQTIPVEADPGNKMEMTAVRSYLGVTLSWSENDFFGNYYIVRKTDGVYTIQTITHLPSVTISDLKEGDSVLAVAYNFDDKEGVTPVKISSKYVFSEGNFYICGSDEPKVSVVIPVYNSEKLMVRCIDSVLSSSLKDLEVIIVDDGSTDDSPAVADWYKDNYPGAVNVIHTENQGVARARNEGIKAARGEFIAFADCDDSVSSGMYKTLYERAVKYECDISMCAYTSLMDAGIAHQPFPFEETGAYDIDWLLAVTFAKKYRSVSVWNKIYKAALVKEHPFTDLKYEDSAWSPMIYSYAEKFCYSKAPFYFYERTVPKDRVSLSFEYSKLSPLERAVERVKAYETGLKKGNQEKRALLLQIYVRLITIHLLENNPEDAIIQYVSFLLVHKKEIIKNEYIVRDIELAKLIDRIYAQFVLDEETNRIGYIKK